MRIEFEAGSRATKRVQRGGVSAAVEIIDDAANLRGGFERGAKRGGVDGAATKFVAFERRQRAQTAVRRRVRRGHQLVRGFAVVAARGDVGEFARGLRVSSRVERGEARGSSELRDRGRVGGDDGVREAQRLGCVRADVGVVLRLDADADDVQAHLNDVARGGAVVAGADIALERGLRVAAVAVKVAEVGVAHPDGLLDHVRLVPVELGVENLLPLRRAAVRLLDPRAVELVLGAEATADALDDGGVRAGVVALLEKIRGVAKRVQDERLGLGALGDEQKTTNRSRGGVARHNGIQVHRGEVHIHHDRRHGRDARARSATTGIPKFVSTGPEWLSEARAPPNNSTTRSGNGSTVSQHDKLTTGSG